MYADQNPFRVQRIHSLPYQFTDGRTIADLLPQLADQLAEKPQHFCLLGPHGVGKTTLLNQLQEHFSQEGFYTNAYSAAPRNWLNSWQVFQSIRRNIGASHRETDLRRIVFLDSGECLGTFAWWAVRRVLRKTHLITTLHQPRGIPALVECGSSSEVFLRHCQTLLHDTPMAAAFSESKLVSIYNQCSGNSRAAFFRLYELCAALPDGDQSEIE